MAALAGTLYAPAPAPAPGGHLPRDAASPQTPGSTSLVTVTGPATPPVPRLADLGIKVTLCGFLERPAALRRVRKVQRGRCKVATPAGGWRPESRV